jgi:hypothetical protein
VLRVIEAQLGRLTSEVTWRGLVATCLAGIIASSWATAGATLRDVNTLHHLHVDCYCSMMN